MEYHEDFYTDPYTAILRQLLQQSGFANETVMQQHVRYFPCRKGTFVNASIKDWPSCELCPPGKFLPCDLTLANVPLSISLSLSLSLKFQTLVLLSLFSSICIFLTFIHVYIH